MAGERPFAGGKPDELHDFLESLLREGGVFRDRLDFEAFARHYVDMPRPAFVSPERPERQSALEQCRKIKRLRDSTTFEGERGAAQRRMDGIMAKHGIAAHEV